MAYTIVFDREALEDMKRLPKKDRLTVQAQIEQFLTHEPTRGSTARIRRLRGEVFPPYRLRIDPYRVLYDVDEEAQEVIIHGVGQKPEIYARLQQQEEESP